MKITSINRKMPMSKTLQRVGSTDSRAFGRTSRTYRKGGLMFTITASQSEWTEFDSSGYLHRMEMITDHLSDEDASLLYRSDAETSRGVAAVNSFLAKLDEEQEAAAAKARKAKAEKAAAEQTAAMEAAETVRQQKLAEMMATMLQQQYGLKPIQPDTVAPTTQQAVPATTATDTTAPATPQTTAPAATTTTPTADQQQQSTTAITQQEINAIVAEALKQCGFQPTTATAPATPTAPQVPENTQATPQAPADDKSKGGKNGKK